MNETRKIVVREPNWLGDVLMSLPFWDALRDREPEAKRFALVRPSVAAVLQHHPAIDRIVICDDQGEYGGLGLFSMAENLKKEGFDAAYILPNSFGSALMMRFAAIPERIGFATDGRSFMLTHPVKKTRALRSTHETLSYLALLGEDVTGRDPVAPKLLLTGQEELQARQMLEQLNVNRQSPLVGMVCGAAYGTAKRWPADRFAAVARKIMKEAGGEILLFGTAREKPVADIIEQRVESKQVHNLAGQTGLRQLAALCKVCDIVISNDTGAMHVASAVGTPLVALFGSTNPVTTSPVGKQHCLLRHPVDCSPCLLRHCPIDHRCMNRITVNEVYDAAERVLRTAREKKGESTHV